MRILDKNEDFDDFLIKNMIFSLKTLWVRSIAPGGPAPIQDRAQATRGDGDGHGVPEYLLRDTESGFW